MRPCARYAALHGYAELASSFGLDPERLLARVGLDIRDLDVADRWVPAVAVARLLELSAAESGRADFGVQLAQRRRLSTIGPLSVVLREEPDLRSALELLTHYEHSYNEAIRVTLTEADGLATMAGWFELGEPAPTRQLEELAVAALLGLIRRIRAPGWQPLVVRFTHPAPADLTAHRLLLGPAVRFDQDVAGLVFPARELDSRNALADADDPQMHVYARQFLEALPPPQDGDLVGRVREVVLVLLPLRQCTMSQVARALGVSKRTLHRLLEARQESFAGIVADARAGLAERYLATSRYSITDVSDMLGFAAPSAFARWFRRRFGISPTSWRAAAATLGGQPPTVRRAHPPDRSMPPRAAWSKDAWP